MYKEYKLNSFTDDRGSLCPIELSELNLFDIKRVYSVYANKQKRGGHAHFNEEEFFFMAEGSCICRLHDGTDWIQIELTVGINAVYVSNMVWHEFDNFSNGASLVALSSTSYNHNRSDYIEDFNDFLNSFNKDVQ